MSVALAEKSWTVALRAQADQGLEIYVYDAIGADFFEDGVTAKDIVAKLQSAPDAEKITLRINSVGGILNEAKTMGNLLAERAARGTEILAKVDGLAASAASYLLTFATRVEMPTNGFQMIHQGRAGIRGTADEMEARAALLRRENEQIADAYAGASARRGKTKSKEDFLEAFKKGDLYLDADQAIEWGLADAKIEPLKTAACLADITTLADVPELISAAPYVTRASSSPSPAPTESPATPALPPVAVTPGSHPEGSKPMKMISLAAIAAVLGMSAEQIEKAEESDVLEAGKKLKAKADTEPTPSVAISGVKLLGVATEAEATAKIQDLQRGTLQVLGATGKATVAEAMPVILGWKSGADQAVAMTTKVAELTEEARVAKRDAAIAASNIPPARHDWARVQFATAEAVETFSAGLPAGFFDSINEPNKGEVQATLTADEKTICKNLGMSEAQYLEEKKLLRKAG